MKSIFAVIMALSLTIFAGCIAIAQTVVPPETVEHATSLIPQLIQAAIEGKWIVVGSIVVMVLTAAFRQYAMPKLNISTSLLPWVALVIAFLNGVAAHTFGGVDIKEAVTMILVSGGLASQFWSLGGKVLTEVLLNALGKKVAK